MFVKGKRWTSTTPNMQIIPKEELCLQNCPYLSLTEYEQNKMYEEEKIKPPHICKLYNKQVTHGKYHPNLIRLEECNLGLLE